MCKAKTPKICVECNKMADKIETTRVDEGPTICSIIPTDCLTDTIAEIGPQKTKFITPSCTNEFYRLNPQLNRFNSEAFDEIVNQLSKPQFQGKLVIILAGYAHEVCDLLKQNPGLFSRFSESIEFPSVCQ
ncbi:hypothetical protein CONCODRAFT_3914 [Conidiobolus coronatus NRRL 28638]|uniref:Uncharacterized protein n=1 Tax=Conidiobolus coronatus (strain ATCC 28846 / CBS 209.66 / NRRL 28638) TaxID=796925 RepID=A0A137PE10_CONC2|nr:hypothetical protein CONCODRAFT_3914 [Conidiobolus coronatus NRRL 28638]|eukprot:KXN73238.1 hypothetical protein CONCODRAFT_3914 [Conidiobolus coronatus NRRL 28638]